MGENRPQVSISCVTYNHAPYIRDAIEGFLMQKTNFPFEIIINDDASTDGTTEIVKEYADKYSDLIVPIFQKENQYSKGIKPFSIVRARAKGKYIALCEGDDYWIDPLKLQKQFDYMEKNKDCSFSFHSVKVGDRKNRVSRIARANCGNRKYNNEKLFQFDFGAASHTSSLFFRAKYFKTPPSWYNSSPVGDYALKLLLLSKGCAYYIDDVMSVWRTKVNSSWNERLKKNKSKKRRYLQEMVIMLEGFNKYSDFKYDSQIREKQLEYQIKSLQFDSIKKRVQASRGSEYKGATREMSFWKKTKLYFILFLPRTYRVLIRIKEKIK